MSKTPVLELLESPAWVRVESEAWLKGGFRVFRRILRAPNELERHQRLVEVVNTTIYRLRDYPLFDRPEIYGGASGGALLHLLVDQKLRAFSHGKTSLADLLAELEKGITKDFQAKDSARLYLRALGKVTPVCAIYDLAYQILEWSFPQPVDEFLHRELSELGWSFERVPYETVTRDQAFRDGLEEKEGPSNLMNHLGRLIGWADSYPTWSFQVDGWSSLRFNAVQDGDVFQTKRTVVEVEGYPLPLGAGPAYGVVRRLVLEGKPFKVRCEGEDQEHTIHPKIFPRRRAQCAPETFLRVSLPEAREKSPESGAKETPGE